MPSWQMLASIFLVIKMSFSTCMLCVRCCAVAIIGSAMVRLVKITLIRLNIIYIYSFYQNNIVQMSLHVSHEVRYLYFRAIERVFQPTYRTRAIIGRSRFEAALVYKPPILSLKYEEFPFLVHKLSAI